MPHTHDGRLACLANNVLHLIVMPTEACNFRCVYCYETFEVGRMRPAVVEGIKAFLTRRAPGLDALRVAWFGGEPLMAQHVIENVLLHARGLAAGQPRLRVASEITTNAYLMTPGVFKKLLGLGVTLYQISFDGPREIHDAKRVRINGGPTFDRIWSNVAATRDVQGEFTLIVRLHVDRENAGSAPEFIAAFCAAFGGDPRFRLFVRELSRFGGPNDAHLAVLEPDEAPQVLDGLRRYAAERGALLYQPAAVTPVCYASHGNSFVVRADGRINKCTLALEHPRNQVGRIFADGHVELDDPLMGGWMRGVLSGDAEELRCPMRGHADPEPRVSAVQWRVPIGIG